MTPDGAGDEPPILGRIDQSTIRQVQRLASTRAEELCRSHGLHLAMFQRPSRSHFAIRKVDYGEGSLGIPQE
jgi:hypothetical protein